MSVYFEAPADEDGPDPADQQVDADIATDGTWQENAAVLAQRYGVTYEEREERFRTRFIEVSR